MAETAAGETESNCSLQEDAVPYTESNSPQSNPNSANPNESDPSQFNQTESQPPESVPNPSANQVSTKENPDVDPVTESKGKILHDVALVFAEDDEELADGIMDEMQNERIDARLFNDETCFSPDIVERPNIVCESCLIIFIVHTDNTSKDLVTKYTKNETVANLRLQKGADNIRTLRIKDGLVPLAGLASLQPLDWYKDNRIKKLSGIIECERKKRMSDLSGRLRDLTLQPRKPGKDEESYKMTANPRGHCYIFNNKKFLYKPHRLGNENDRDGLEDVFRKLQFEVTVFDDKDADVIRTEIENLSKRCHLTYDCVVLIFLTHGTEGRIYGSDDDTIKIDEITFLFQAHKCPSLAHKPKMFFFASCRGTTWPIGVQTDGPGSDDDDDKDDNVGKDGDADKEDNVDNDEYVGKDSIDKDGDVGKEDNTDKNDDVDKKDNVGKDGDVDKVDNVGKDGDAGKADNAGKDQDGGKEIMKLVAPEAHFFLGYATVPKKKAIRNIEAGSWYIQTLIKVLQDSSPSQDFLSLMTDVKRELHKRKCETTSGNFYKQTAMSAHSLHFKLYLKA